VLWMQETPASQLATVLVEVTVKVSTLLNTSAVRYRTEAAGWVG
jgi:hypothetical protein